MIAYDEALAAVLKHASRRTSVERIPLEEAVGRVLAEDAMARFDVPLFDQSAVDGFAVRSVEFVNASSDTPVALRVASTVRAGDSIQPRIRAGHAVKIMTGGRVPPDADAIVMKESCEELDAGVTVRAAVSTGNNIRYKGEEFRKGARVLVKGTRITPPVIGLLATFGHAAVRVYQKPRVTLLVTGSELIKPGDRLRPGKIYDSNSYALSAACTELGIECRRIRLKDEASALRKAVSVALQSSDIVLTAGGVSVGEYDLLKDIFADLGVKEIFWGVAIKPGKPCYFGTWKKSCHSAKQKRPVLVFGLPGNPVAALLCFHQLVEPAIHQLMGQIPAVRITLPARIQGQHSKRGNRLEWLRGSVTRVNGSLSVVPVEGQGSHMLGGLAQANCLIAFPRDRQILDEGESVDVEVLNWRPQ